MFLLTFLFLKFSLLDLQDALIGLPSSLPMQDEVALGVQTVCHLRERVVTAVAAHSHLLVEDAVFFPTEIALVDEPANTADLSAVQRQQLDSHLHCHVLKSEICTD